MLGKGHDKVEEKQASTLQEDEDLAILFLGEMQRATKLLEIARNLSTSHQITTLINNYKSKTTFDIDIQSLLAKKIELAIMERNFVFVKGVLESNYHFDCNQPTSNGQLTLLILAVISHNSPEMIEFLIDKGADVNVSSPLGILPLDAACTKHNKEVIKLLIRHGADLNNVNPLGYPSSVMFVYNDAVDMLKWLSTEFDIDFHTLPLALTLHMACLHHSKQCVTWLLENQKMNPNQSDLLSLKPLDYAISHNALEIMELLLAHGADVSCANHSGGTPFTTALEKGSTKTQRRLLEHPTFNVHVTGEPYLHLAVQRCHMDIIRGLVTKGANINELDANNVSALSKAIIAGNFKATRYLLNLNADVTLVDNQGLQAIDYAVWSDSIKILLVVAEKCTLTLSLDEKLSFYEGLLEKAIFSNKKETANYIRQCICDLEYFIEQHKAAERKTSAAMQEKETEEKIIEVEKKTEEKIKKAPKKRKEKEKVKKNGIKKPMPTVNTEVDSTTWLNGLISSSDVTILDNHKGYRAFVARNYLEGEAGDASVTLDNLLNLERWKICRIKGASGIKLFNPRSMVKLYVGGVYMGEFPIHYELKKTTEKARVYGIEVPADVVNTMQGKQLATKLMLFCKFDPKGLHDSNTLPGSLVINIPRSEFPMPTAEETEVVRYTKKK